MRTKHLLLPLLAVVLTMPKKAGAQQDDQSDRRISIEITTTEDGNTTTKRIDLDNASEAEIEEALREMGVMDHFIVEGDDGNVVIDIRKFGGADEAEKHMRLRTFPPTPPAPPMPPMPPGEPYTWLGVSTEKLSGDLIEKKDLKVKEGVYVIEVIEGSPAEKAGLQAGDVIVAVDGEEIADPRMLSATIRSKDVGDEVKITYFRDGKKRTTETELGQREATSFSFGHGNDDRWKEHFKGEGWQRHMEKMRTPRAFLGVTAGDDENMDGAVIGSVEEGSSAEKMGLKEGDVIRSVNGEAIEDLGDLSEKISAMRPGEKVTLKIDRSGTEQELSGELGEREMHFNFNFDMPEGEHFHFDFEGLDEEQKEHFRQEMEELQREMDKLREEIKDEFGNELRSETRMTIQSRKLTDEEKAMLKDKGVKGLDNELELGDLSTFPNPSNGFFRIHFDVPAAGDLEVDVHDASGERVYQEKITGYNGRYERTLDLSDKAAGNYFLVIRQNGKATSRKLIKQ